MQLNQATDYAFRVILHLSMLKDGDVAAGQTIAERQHIPPRFLQKISRSLVQAGLIKSFRGVDGGFALARKAARITLLDVIVAMEGPIDINRCLNADISCNSRCKSQCPVHEALGEIQRQLLESLASVTFADLAEKSQQEER